MRANHPAIPARPARCGEGSPASPASPAQTLSRSFVVALAFALLFVLAGPVDAQDPRSRLTGLFDSGREGRREVDPAEAVEGILRRDEFQGLTRGPDREAIERFQEEWQKLQERLQAEPEPTEGGSGTGEAGTGEGGEVGGGGEGGEGPGTGEGGENGPGPNGPGTGPGPEGPGSGNPGGPGTGPGGHPTTPDGPGGEPGPGEEGPDGEGPDGPGGEGDSGPGEGGEGTGDTGLGEGDPRAWTEAEEGALEDLEGEEPDLAPIEFAEQRESPEFLVGLFRGLMYSVVGVGFGVLAFGLVFAGGRWWKRRGVRKAVRKARKSALEVGLPDAPETRGILDLSPESWEDVAAEEANSGRFREAIRAVYHALLTGLHRSRRIEFAPTRSNADYVESMTDGASKDRFSAATNLFDGVWYGNRPCGEREYGEERALVAEILAGGEDVGTELGTEVAMGGDGHDDPVREGGT